MPNWCSNHITIEGSVGAITNIQFIIEHNDDNLMAVRPRPEDIGDDWYSWSVKNWGTKWEMAVNSIESHVVNDDRMFLTIQGDTAWAPPVELLRFITERFTDVICHITYVEEGMDFCGAVTCVNGEVFESTGSISDNLPHDPHDEGGNYDQQMVNDTIDKLLCEHEDVVGAQLTEAGN